jgi:hypothetical protein
MKKFVLGVSVAGLTLLSACAWAQSFCNGPNLLVNPGFEQPVVPNGNGANNIVASIPGWTNRSLTPTTVNVVRPTGGGTLGPTTAHEGDQYIDLQGGGIMDQAFTITEPVQLAFSGNFANRGANLPGYTPGQIGIQIFNADLSIVYAVESSALTQALGNSTWVTVSGLTSVLQPGTYVFRFFARTDFAHYDDFSVCVATNAAQACLDRSVLKPQPGWSATASSSFAGMPASKAIDGSIRDISGTETDTWAAAFGTSAGEYITFDYGTAQNLVGFVYYPRTLVAEDIRNYTVQSSNDGTTFTDIQSGTMVRQTVFETLATPPVEIRVGNPIEVNFVTAVSARYLRLVARLVEGGNIAAIAELLPIVCGAQPVDDISCVNADLLNTGTNAAGDGLGTLNSFDSNWEVMFVPNAGATYTNTLPLLSSVPNPTYMPAIITGNKIPNTWADSPFGNAQWISYTQSSRDANVTALGDGVSQNSYFFRYRFNLTDPYLLPAFKLRLNFLADNVTKNIYVNGNGLAPQFGLPGGGFQLSHQTQTSLNQHWQLGENEIIVQLYSQPSLAGFLGQNITTCPGLDFGDAPASYNVSRTSFGAGHIVETDQSGNVTLKLGSLIDSEPDGVASFGTSDNTVGQNDEDGVSTFPGIPAGTNPTITNYTINVAVANVTGATANLCGWIDWDNNGVFDAGESVCTTVPNNATSAQLVWPTAVFNGQIGGSTYARVRITTDALSSPNGAASNGEVEDYLITFGPLPVKLSSFDAVKQENTAALNWTTTEETQSDRFEIEHSLEGKTWNTIGTVKSGGESTSVKHYSYIDSAPANGANFYRLKMVDTDGTFAYSRIRNLQFDGIEASVYPNPVSDKLFIHKPKGVRQVTVFNVAGQKVIELSKISANGMDISKLSAGIYVVNIRRDDGSNESGKVLIVK